MRLNRPRIEPLPVNNWAEDIAPLAERMRDGPLRRVVNLFKTLAHHPRALKRYITFANHIIHSSLSDREREILILRTAWLCEAEYEWGHHVEIGKAAGLTAEEIVRIKAGREAIRWSERERLLIEATNELHTDSFIAAPTWSALLGFYSTPQIVDIVFTVGNYTMLAMLLNSLGVQLDEGLVGFNGKV